MRWFKHLTTANRDEKLMQLVDEFGWEGYGLYFFLLELIAERCDSENNQTFLRLTTKSWQRHTGLTPKRLKIFLKFCDETEIFQVTFDGDFIKVDCPNLLKYRDEYTKKRAKKKAQNQESVRRMSGHTPDNVPVDTETDTETETEAEREDIDSPELRAQSATPSEPAATHAPPSGQVGVVEYVALQKAEAEVQKPNPRGQPPKTSEAEAEENAPVITIPLVGKQGDYAVTRDDVAEWTEAYPAVDVLQELREMRQWALSNPTRRKTRRGVRKFITGWLAREQDRGGVRRRDGPQATPVTPRDAQLIQREALAKFVLDRKRRRMAPHKGVDASEDVIEIQSIEP